MNFEKNISFFDLLCLNDPDKLKEFLLTNGKGPKVRCPVTFMDMNNLDEINFYGPFKVC